MESVTEENETGTSPLDRLSESCENSAGQIYERDKALPSPLDRIDEEQLREPDAKSVDEELSISLSDGAPNMDTQQEDAISSTESPTKLNTTFEIHRSMPLLEHPSHSDDNFRLSQDNIRDDADSVIKQQQQELIVQAEQINSLIEQTRSHTERIGDLEATIINANRTCSQLESMLKQELNKRSSLENDNLNLISELCKLRLKLNSSDQQKKRDDEKINLLNATLMERETEISILKLKLTRAQTNAPSGASKPTSTNQASDQNQLSFNENNLSSQPPRLRPPQNYSITRLDNQQNANSLQRNINLRQQQMDQHQNQSISSDQQYQNKLATNLASSLYSTPSSIPINSNNQASLSAKSNYNNTPIYGNITSPYVASGYSQALSRGDRRYRTLPRNMPSNSLTNNFYHQPKTLATTNISGYDQRKYQRSHSTSDQPPTSQLQEFCTITNLDDSNESRHTTNNVTTASPTKGHSRDSLQKANEGHAYDQVPTLTNTINPHHSYGDESIYATIDKLGTESRNSQSRSNSLMAHSGDNRTLDALDNNITAPQHQLPMVPKQKSGLRRILNKFKRSGSGSAELKDADDILLTINHNSNFKRGGNRSTTTGAFPSISNNQPLSMNMLLANKKAAFETTKPFGEWDTNMIAEWLTTIGLSMYSSQCKRWAKNGSHIMNATASEVERGLSISNTLHRKKLRLAISELNGDSDKVTKAAANLDYLWVARWLDDIGLPQYKEQFINNRIDGRVLNYLTVEDLVSMNITSLLHHASIKSGIRVLRSINFDLQALKRRATSDEIDGMMQWSTGYNQQHRSPSRSGTFTRNQVCNSKSAQRNSYDSNYPLVLNNVSKSPVTDDQANLDSLSSFPDSGSSTVTSSSSPKIARSSEPPAALGLIGSGSGSGVPSNMPAQPDIALWTCHRVMEWLRLIDFSEFAPNLRGSGVHGGLIIYEDGFNADLMSSLLSIPDDKTLLRRHIYSLFKELIGKDLFQQKRQYESHPHYTPLTPTSELKLVKKSQFSLLRRSRSKVGQDTTVEEYLCPTYPIEARFKQHAADNAARDAADEQQQEQSMTQESATYANCNQFDQNKRPTRPLQMPSDSTIV